MEDLIDPIDRSWKVDFLNAHFHPDDVKIICGLAVSRAHRFDSYGWMFTESGKYTVKSGFRTKSLYPDKGSKTQFYGPNVKPLLAFSWKLKCSPKLKYLVWQAISGVLPVGIVLRTRGINCDPRCSICGAEEETINHILFE